MQAMRQASARVVLMGAYGRVYDSKADAVRDWEKGLDFKIQGGPYCSIRDLDRLVDDSSGVYLETRQGFKLVA